MLVNHRELRDIRNDTSPQTIALTVGCFDIVHEGHLEQITFAADQADILAVAVMPDEYVKRRKDPSRPIYNQRDRAENIDSSKLVDYTFIAPQSLLARAKTFIDLRPDVCVEHKEHEAERIHLLKSLFLGSLARCLRLGEPELSTVTTTE